MCRARDPHFQLYISAPEHIILHFLPFRRPSFSKFSKSFCTNYKNIPLRSITILHFLPFRRPSFSKCIYVQAVHRRPRPAYWLTGLAAGKSASQTRPTVSSGDIFRSSSLRSPPFFTLPRHLTTKIWGECPPPPSESSLRNISRMSLCVTTSYIRLKIFSPSNPSIHHQA